VIVLESKIERRLGRYGREHLELTTPKEVIHELYVEQELSLDAIAKLLEVTRPGVAYTAKKLGIELQSRGRPSSLASKVERLGYGSEEEYFRKNGMKPFDLMARELGLATDTVRKHYDAFLEAQGVVPEKTE
jgi:predicted ArsR family transcriptional regulator